MELAQLLPIRTAPGIAQARVTAPLRFIKQISRTFKGYALSRHIYWPELVFPRSRLFFYFQFRPVQQSRLQRITSRHEILAEEIML